MEAGPLNVWKIFGQDRRNVVPLFQRPYIWQRETHWAPLWDDSRAVAERLLAQQPARPHFLGAIVVDQQRKPMGHLETRLVIDGQQRLTTIQLLLEAFADLCDTPATERHHKALLKLTRNDDPLSNDPDDEFKVWPTNVDRDHFRNVMRAGSPDQVRKAYGQKPGAAEIDHPIGDAYLYFSAVIGEWLALGQPGADARVEALYTTVRDYIRMVVIDLGPEDDAQVIFETLNARGAPLLPSDLVKNFLFHLAQLQGQEIDSLYRQYWRPFDDEAAYWRQELGRGHARRARIDTFLQHYLTLRTGDEVPVAHLYTSFRNWADDGNGNASVQLKDLRRYAEVYQAFDRMPPESPDALFFERLALMETTTAYPFLLELFARYRDDEGTIRSVLSDLESFLVRRMVCQLNTRGYNRLFVELLGTLRGDGATPAGRVHNYLLSSEAESNRWPKDGEFREAWLDGALYRVLIRQRVRLLLEALERQLHTDKVEKIHFGEKLTIEHLLPQEWRKYWPLLGDAVPEEAEARRERMLHTMGNLTLLTKKLNPSISNGPWERKQHEILVHSALNLNRQLPPEWNERAIRQRGEKLFERAKQIWPRPEK